MCSERGGPEGIHGNGSSPCPFCSFIYTVLVFSATRRRKILILPCMAHSFWKGLSRQHPRSVPGQVDGALAATYLAVPDTWVVVGVGCEHPPQRRDARLVLEGRVLRQGAVQVALNLLGHQAAPAQ